MFFYIEQRARARVRYVIRARVFHLITDRNRMFFASRKKDIRTDLSKTDRRIRLAGTAEMPSEIAGGTNQQRRSKTFLGARNPVDFNLWRWLPRACL